jgi:hypothetical protein
VLGVQVDLIVSTVQPETDSTVGLTAVEVINENGLHFLTMAALFLPLI